MCCIFKHAPPLFLATYFVVAVSKLWIRAKSDSFERKLLVEGGEDFGNGSLSDVEVNLATVKSRVGGGRRAK